MTNAYDSAFEDERRRMEEERVALAARVNVNVPDPTLSPDDAAAVRRANRLGGTFSSRQEADAAIRAYQNNNALETSPRLQRYMASASNAALMHDDLPALSFWERTGDLLYLLEGHPNRSGGEIARATGFDRYQRNTRIAELAERANPQSALPRMNEMLGYDAPTALTAAERREWARLRAERDARGPSTDLWSMIAENAPYMVQSLGSSVEGMFRGVARGVRGADEYGLEGYLNAAPSAIASGVMGLRAGPARFMYIQEAGGAFDEYTNMVDVNGNRLDPNIAGAYARDAGLVNATLEAFEFSSVMKLVGAGELLEYATRGGVRSALRRMGYAEAARRVAGAVGGPAATEFVTEGAQEGSTILFGQLAQQAAGGEWEKLSDEDIAARIFEAARAGALMGGLMGGAVGGAVAVSDVNVIRRVRLQEALFNAINEGSAASVLRTRAPGAFADAVNELTKNGPLAEVSIDAEAFAAAFNQDIEEARAAADQLPGVGRAALDAALEGGGVITIPMGTWATMTGSPLGEHLRPNIRMGPDQMTPAEVRAKMELGVDLERATSEAVRYQAEAKKLTERVDQVEARINAQFETSEFIPQARRNFVKLYAQHIVAMAQRAGVDPVVQLDRMGFSLKGPLEAERAAAGFEAGDLGAVEAEAMATAQKIKSNLASRDVDVSKLSAEEAEKLGLVEERRQWRKAMKAAAMARKGIDPADVERRAAAGLARSNMARGRSFRQDGADDGFFQGADEVAPWIAGFVTDEQVAEFRALIADPSTPPENILDHPVIAAIEANAHEAPTMTKEQAAEIAESDNVYTIDGQSFGVAGYVQHMIAKAEAEMRVPVKRQRIATILIGQPGAGKSSTSGAISDVYGAVPVDMDRYRLGIEGFDGGRGSSLVTQAEAAGISRLVLEALIAERKNFVHEVVGAKASQIEELADRYREAGYTVILGNVSVDFSNSVRRYAARTLSSGRFVHAAFINAVGDSPRATFASLLEKDNFDGYIQVDGNGPKNSETLLLAHQTDADALKSALRSRRDLPGGEGTSGPQEAGNQVKAPPFYSSLLRSLEALPPKTELTAAEWLDRVLYEPERVVRSARRDPKTNKPMVGEDGKPIIDERVIPRAIRMKGVKQEELDWVGPLGLEAWLNSHDGLISRQDVLVFVGMQGVRVELVALGDGAASSALTPAEEQDYLLLVEERDRMNQAVRALMDDQRPMLDPELLARVTLGERVQGDAIDTGAISVRPFSFERGDQPNIVGRIIETADGFEVAGNTGSPTFHVFETEEMAIATVATRSRALELDPLIQPYLQKVNAYKNESAIRWSTWRTPGAEIADMRELVVTVPGIAPWNTSDTSHYGDVGGGTSIGWARYDLRTDANGVRTAHIDELQSKRHQKGEEEGYQAARHYYAVMSATGSTVLKQGGRDGRAIYADRAEAEAYAAAHDGWYVKPVEAPGVGDAPFKANAWRELMLKAVLREVISKHPDVQQITWTTGEQQAERYNLGAKIGLASVMRDTRRGEDRYEVFLEDTDGQRVRNLPGFILVNIANGIGKKYGARVGEAQIMVGLLDVVEQGGRWLVVRPDVRGTVGVHPTEAQAREAMRRMTQESDAYSAKVHALPITQALRDQVLGDGFALFQGGKQPKGSATFTRDAQGHMKEVVMRLFQGRDLSTPIHEFGHIFLETLRLMSADADASAQLKKDWQTTLDWLDITEEKWTEFSLLPAQEATNALREYHEKFARGFEMYVREGKAPSLALADVFSQFKRWLLSIYKTVAELRVDLTPQVREVFDRMLATDEAIAEAMAASGGETPLTREQFPGKGKAADAAYARYVQSFERARAEAAEEIDKAAINALMADRTRWWRRREGQVRRGVEVAFDERPAQRALNWMTFQTWKHGETPEGLEPIRLSPASLIDDYGADYVATLPPGLVVPDVDGLVEQVRLVKAELAKPAPKRMVEVISDLGGIRVIRADGQPTGEVLGSVEAVVGDSAVPVRGNMKRKLINNVTGRTLEGDARDAGMIVALWEMGYFGEGPMPDGVFQLAGANAASADLELLGIAKDMEKQGVSSGLIWQQTGWARSPLHGDWQFEINPEGLRLRQNITTAARAERQMPLRELVDWPELEAAYPEIGDVTIDFVRDDGKQSGGGSYIHDAMKGKGLIYIVHPGGYGAGAWMLSVLRHEIQHYIQRKQGWPAGYNPDAVRKSSPRWQAAVDRRVESLRFYYRVARPNMKVSDEWIRMQAEEGAANDVYMAEKGEVEARLVQARAHQDAETRRMNPPGSGIDPEYLARTWRAPVDRGFAQSDGPDAGRDAASDFDTSRTFYHATTRDFSDFDLSAPSWRRQNQSAVGDGVWLAKEPTGADRYLRGEPGSNVRPIHIRRGRLLREEDWDGDAEQAIRDGYIGTESDDAVMIFRPEDVTSVFSSRNAPNAGDAREEAIRNADPWAMFQGERPTIREFLELLERDLKGQHVYSINDEERVEALRNAERMRDWFAERGVDIKAKAKDLRAQVAAMAASADTQGVDADFAASIFGFDSGKEMLDAIIAEPDRLEAVKAETRKRMLDEYGDPFADGSIAEEARLAAHGARRAQTIEMEMDAFARATGDAERPVGRLARDMAEKQIERMWIKQIRGYDWFLGNERRHAKAALAAHVKGDAQEARMSKYRQLVNHWLYKLARKANDEVDVAIRYFRKFQRAGVRDNIDGEYLDQIDQLLEQYELKKISGPELQRRMNLTAWAAGMVDKGLGHLVNIDPAILERSGRVPIDQLGLDELRGLVDTIKNIEHLGRLKDKLLDLAEKRSFGEVVGTLTDALDATGPISDDVRRNYTPTAFERAQDRMREAHAELTRMEHLFIYLDGIANGPIWQKLWLPFARAADKESAMMNVQARAMGKIWARYSKRERARMFQTRIPMPDLPVGAADSYTKADLLSIALNLGNEGNVISLVDGFEWTGVVKQRGAEIDYVAVKAQIVKALSRVLDARDWQTVQQIWDLIAMYRDEAFQLQEDLTGVRPEAVAATPVETPFGNLAGGYYPLKFDRTRDRRVAKAEQKQEVQELWGSNWSKPMTRHGHTINRVGSGGRPVKLSLTVATEHMQNVIHDIAYRRAVVDADRIITDARFADTFTRVAGLAMYEQLRPWLQAIAADKVDPSSFAVKFFQKMRGNTAVAQMGFKIGVGMQQFAGLLQAVPVVGGVEMGGALVKLFAQPHLINAKAKFILNRSEFMRTRVDSFDRDAREQLTKMEKNDALDPVREFGFRFLGMFDWAVSSIVWTAAFEKARAGKVKGVDPMIEADAVTYADSVVRQTQSAGLPQDMPAVMRSGEGLKMFTVYYNYFSVLYNWTAYSQVMGVRKGRIGPAEFAANMALIYVIGPLIAEFLAGRGLPKDDEEPDDYLKRMAWSVFGFWFAPIPILRDVINSLVPGRTYQMSPVGASINTTLDAVKRVSAGNLDSEYAQKQTAMAIGYAFGVPSAQLWITGDYVRDTIEGDEPTFDPVEALVRDQR